MEYSRIVVTRFAGCASAQASLVAVLTLALGIGAYATIFSVMNATLPMVGLRYE